MTEAKTERFN